MQTTEIDSFRRDVIRWKSGLLHEFDALTVFKLFKLRQAVFILEQQCLYPDMDALDESALHLVATDEHDNLIACLRIIPPESEQHDVAIGRVVVSPNARGLGIGRQLVEKGIELCRQEYSTHAIHISAQSHLLSLYESTGFVSYGDEYLEDGIPHKAMRLVFSD